jgi:predicted flavoprotein YhiN
MIRCIRRYRRHRRRPGRPDGAQQLGRCGAPGACVRRHASVGRKFLLAGRVGLNLTHSEPADVFLSRYGARLWWRSGWRARCGPACKLGLDTFVGTSGRVFPAEMKAAPLLRAWLVRLRAAGVQFHMRQRWHGWADDGTLLFLAPCGGLPRRSGCDGAGAGGQLATAGLRRRLGRGFGG